MKLRRAMLVLAGLLFAVIAAAGCDKGEDRHLPIKEPLVVMASDVTRQVAPNGKAWITRLADGNHAFLGILETGPGGGVPKHRDASEEFIYVLEGSGTLTIDGREYPVGPGTSIFMPANAEVSYVNGEGPLKVLQVFADPTSARKYDTWKPE